MVKELKHNNTMQNKQKVYAVIGALLVLIIAALAYTARKPHSLPSNGKVQVVGEEPEVEVEEEQDAPKAK